MTTWPHASGLPVLATVPRGPESARREAVRELRTNLALMTPSFDAPSTIAVLGVDAGVGCTETAIELARAAAAGSRTVLLVDGNMRRPDVHDRLGLALTPGLSEVLLRGAELVTGLAPGGRHGVVAPCPRRPASRSTTRDGADRAPSRSGPRAGHPASRVTVIDTPPISAVADAAAIAAQCDTTVLVIDARTTSRRAVRDVLERLRQVGVMPLGDRRQHRRAVCRPPAGDLGGRPRTEVSTSGPTVTSMPVRRELPPPVR